MLRRIEEDEWIVSDPAAIAAGVLDTGATPSAFADPADRIVHLAVTRPCPRLKTFTLSVARSIATNMASMQSWT